MKRTRRFDLTLSLLWLTLIPTFLAAQNPAWGNLTQLTGGQKIRVVLSDGKSYKGEFQSFTEGAIAIHSGGADQTLSRQSVKQVSYKGAGHRLRNTLIGAGVGAGVGLAIGAGIDGDCQPMSIVCTGNKGKAIGTPAFGVLGAVIGAVIPTGGWHEIYHSI
jgi:hypothetical protein